ncbi:hypothetical protein [Bacteroides luti]|jgi:hypothetical protein|uniref:hypothetical protein n=1 Tax=Bacteroides luti TaxID=1297750 RepID=UPI001587B6F6|nr:hypothetical protein [Bacteroides luti]
MLVFKRIAITTMSLLLKAPIKAKTIKRTRSLRKKSDNSNGGQLENGRTTLKL